MQNTDANKAARLYYKTYLHKPEAPWVTLIHGVGGSSIIWYIEFI